MKKKLLIIAVAIVGLGGAGGAYFLGYLPGSSAQAETGEAGEMGEDAHVEVEYDDHGEPIIPGRPIYMTINPPFVVNFTHLGTLRYLQVSLSVMYNDQRIIDRVSTSLPAIRNELILLLSDQKFEKLSSTEGKEELRTEMLAAINHRVLTQEDTDIHGEVFITNFVMQ